MPTTRRPRRHPRQVTTWPPAFRLMLERGSHGLPADPDGTLGSFDAFLAALPPNAIGLAAWRDLKAAILRDWRGPGQPYGLCFEPGASPVLDEAAPWQDEDDEP